MPESQPRAAKGWSKIVKKLNVRQEAEELGIVFVGNETAKSYVGCWAVDRPQGDSASAGVNLKSGWYKDHGGTGLSGYLYQIAVVMGRFPNEEEALIYYAQKADAVEELAAALQGAAYNRDAVKILGWQPVLMVPFFQRYPTITPEAVQIAGGQYGTWPANSPSSSSVIAFKSYDKNFSQLGWSLQSVHQNGIFKYQGKDKPGTREKKINLGSQGMVNDHAVRLIRENKAKLIIKTEGESDMLAVQSVVPEHLRDEIVVWTNNSGCESIPPCLQLFRGIPTVVLHDSDVPGQRGARQWCMALRGFVPSLKNLVLHEEIAENRGPDVRDWLAEGHTFEELLQLIEQCPQFSPDEEHLEELHGEQSSRRTLGPDATEEEIQDHQIMTRLGILVLGRIDGSNTIVCYSENSGKKFEIKDIKRFAFEDALLHIGTAVDRHIVIGTQPQGDMWTISQVRRAISRTASHHVLSDSDRMGAGIWEIGNRIVMVNDDSISIANGGLHKSRVPEIGGKVIEFATEPWFDHDEIASLYDLASDHQWCRQVMDEVISIFARWDNWKYRDCPSILAAMVCASWIQSVLDFRPGMVVTGSTNTGKTMLMQETVSKMFGNHCYMMTNVSEAWIRQSVGLTSKILMIDEFEKSRHRKQILDLLRSSTRGTEMGRGTVDQKGATFHLRHIPWLSSIETGIEDAADRNRYIILELDKLPRGHGSTLRVPSEQELEQLGKSLMVIGMQYHGTIRAIHDAIRETYVPGVDRRIVEAYSLPAAVLGAVGGGDVDVCRELMQGMLALRFTEDSVDAESESDESALVSDIAASTILVKGKTFTVAELLTMSSFDMTDVNTTPERELEKVGIRTTSLNGGKGSREKDGVAISYGNAHLKRMLRGTRFEQMVLKDILLRIEGAQGPKKVKFYQSKGKARQLACIVVPLNEIFENDEPEEEEVF